MSKTYLTAAGSILTVEARHSSYIRAGLKQVPFAQPFDAPLSINEVYSLASQFIVSCPPDSPTLPVKAFPVLTMDPKTTMPVKTGSTVTLLTPVCLPPFTLSVFPSVYVLTPGRTIPSRAPRARRSMPPSSPSLALHLLRLIPSRVASPS